jgi:pimeloyl-ACP methyl ester carboxylesterase
LLAPDAASAPTVLIHPGSGPTDRDGNQRQFRNDSLKQLAEALAARGIASLRIDKRGVGASAGAAKSEADLRFDDYMADAAAWLDFLKQRRGSSPVFALGHSEGTLIMTLAAERQPVAGLVLVAGTALRFGVLLRRQLDDAGLPPTERAWAESTLASLEAGRTVDDVRPEWQWLFRPSAQPYLISWARHDPTAALARLTVPALVVQGTTDIQASPADAERLAASRAGVRMLLIDGMNHVLKTAPADRAGNIATYNNPDLPIRDELVDAIANFIRNPNGAKP